MHQVMDDDALATHMARLRFANFTHLFAKFQDDNPDVRPYGALRRFAQHVGLSPKYLSHIKCGRKPMGAATAAVIEKAFKLPAGWMDTPREAALGITPAEQVFVRVALQLFRAQGDDAQELMLEVLRSRLQTPPNTRRRTDSTDFTVA